MFRHYSDRGGNRLLPFEGSPASQARDLAFGGKISSETFVLIYLVIFFD